MGRLFWKIFLGFWLTLLVSGLAVGVAMQLYHQERLRAAAGLAQGPRAEASVAAVAAVLRAGGAAPARALLQQWSGRRRFAVMAVGPNGVDLLGRPVPPKALNLALARLRSGQQQPGLRRVRAPDGRRYVLFRVRLPGLRGPPLRHGPPVLRLALGLVASLLFSGGLAWYLTGPLRHLKAATRRLAAGDLAARVSSAMGHRRDEIADLGYDFDRMAERLEASLGAQKRLLSDVSHELRSPLARLRVAVELARQRPAQTSKALDRIEREAERLDALVGEVLTLSRLEAGVGGEPEDYLDLAELLDEIVADAAFEGRARQRDVALTVNGEAVVRGRAELLRRALENVVRNGVRHTAEHSAVEVRMQTMAPGVMVSICDRGPGVPENCLDSLFDPFVRADTGGDGRGYGLGLAIARRAIEVHGGTIVARLREGGGLCVDITLPLEFQRV